MTPPDQRGITDAGLPDLGAPPDLGTSKLRRMISDEARWIRTESQLASGAITVNYPAPKGRRIVPYFGNLAALGLIEDRASWPAVQQWLDWYFAHLNEKTADKWGLKGTIYDFTVSEAGDETTTGDADSTDSYAATLLTLARRYYDTRDPAAQAFVRAHKYQLDLIGGVLAQTQQADGLTWAKPDYKIKYLMDGCEVFRGLLDLAYLMDVAWRDGNGAAYYARRAADNRQGLELFWDAAKQNYKWAIAADGTSAASSWDKWYPDAVANLFPILEGAWGPDKDRARLLWNGFSGTQGGWMRLIKSDAAPWASVAYVATLMGDTGGADVYVASVTDAYTSKNRPWPWASHEAGWFIRALAALEERQTPMPTGQ